MPLEVSPYFLCHLLNYSRISLLIVPVKVYVRCLNESMMKLADNSVSDEQEGFKIRKGMYGQTFCT